MPPPRETAGSSPLGFESVDPSTERISLCAAEPDERVIARSGRQRGFWMQSRTYGEVAE